MKSNKVTKLEKNRFSILTDNLDECFICKRPRDDINEIFMGRNRQNSMRWGLCIPMCRKCHEEYHRNRNMQLHFMKMGQEAFEKIYPNEKFIKIFLKNYKD